MSIMKSLDHWRSYFRSCSSSSDIFEIIDHAIMVAASDCPKEFKLRRDHIAEMLFSCKQTRCVGCDRVELSVPIDGADGGGARGGGDDDDGAYKSSGFHHNRDGVVEFEAGASKESKVNSSRGDIDDHGDMDVNRVLSNYSFGEAEALTDEMEEQSQFVAEVLRIRDILHNRQEESDGVLFDSLRRLQLMELTFDCLKATEIGKAVNPLRKHASKDIRQLARKLIDDWKEMVDEWVKATAIAGSEGTPDSVNPSVVDEEEGLPSPPLDEGAFLVASTGSIELSQFFDGMDDIGRFFSDPLQSGQVRNRENGRKPSMDIQNMEKRKPQASNDTAKDSKSQLVKKNEPTVKPSRPVAADSGPGRPPKSSMQRKSNVEPRTENGTVTRKPPVDQQDKSNCSDDVDAKLEATKRKLQVRYQEAEKAKRQRTIQVMELNDLPKQGAGQRNPQFKAGNHNRHWANGRR
ncbi:probable mediator of RNA polymerase II transcription subunit 26b isoform X1 [Arachis ipaensis]|uniref:probable mediator of RNA polymerase II transcription subunit 26b isoform X1 n=1 Tax=Arachis ipaensis TaxID=130454 RepID=UPI0007AF6E96|nr:probable mediator of RNA polymerase II transcription subunit 26b isoform X1 [Arachis ipaensis]XP_020968500.1 probable mediator of RNA polymerase II transcription subunit 26b isoform X1 [Arachis ipaensis]